MSYIDELDTTCDGLFLIIDTARHIGVAPDRAEVTEHIRGCPKCSQGHPECDGDVGD